MRRLPISKWEGIGTIVLAIAVTVVPVGGTVIAVAVTTKPNLSGLTPVRNPQANYSLLNWSNLSREHTPNEAVQALGYMFEGDYPVREGAWAQDLYCCLKLGTYCIRHIETT